MVYSQRSNREVWIDVHFLRVNRPFQRRSGRGCARLSQRRRVFHIACINGVILQLLLLLQLLCIKSSPFKAGCLLRGRSRGGSRDRNFRLVRRVSALDDTDVRKPARSVSAVSVLRLSVLRLKCTTFKGTTFKVYSWKYGYWNTAMVHQIK